MNSKKAITLLVLATLIMGILPVIPVHAAITPDDLYDSETPFAQKLTGVKDDVISAKGTGVTAGKTVEVYWDAVQPWSSTTHKGLMNTTTAESSGAYDIWFTVPESTGGDHYIWVRDAETGATEVYTNPFTVQTDAKLSASSGLAGYKPKLTGYGFQDEEGIAIVMRLAANQGTAVAGESVTPSLVSGTKYEITVDHTPIVPGNANFEIYDGGVSQVVVDDGDGTLSGGATGTIDYVTGEIAFDLGGAPAGAVTVDYNYFVDVDDTVYVFSSSTNTNVFGTVSRTLTIPSETRMQKASYKVYVYNGAGDSDELDFTIGAVITLSVEEGPSGTVVEIQGEGFDELTPDNLVQGEIWITDGANTEDCYIMDLPGGGENINSQGEFKLEVVIPVPQTGDWEDYDTLVVDAQALGGGTTTAVEADFDLIGVAGITLDPAYGVQGEVIAIEGWNFTAIDDETVTVELYDLGDDPLTDGSQADIKDFKTDSDGHFSGTMKIPAISNGAYLIGAHQDTYTIADTDEFRIGMMIVIVSPSSGPTGTEVTLSGTGFTAGPTGTWNATFGDITLFEETAVDTNGNIDDGGVPTFYVPTVEPGTYTITVLDIDADIPVEVEFTVTHKSMLELDPIVAPQDYNVSISGKFFTQSAGTTLEFVLYNSTDDWDMEVWTGGRAVGTPPVDNTAAVVLDEDGNFTAWWDFNEGDIVLDIGTYTINCTDDNDLFAQITFDVVSKTVEIDPRKSVFRIGDTLAFNVESSFAQDDSYIKIWDPSGSLYWRTDDFVAAEWLKVGTIERVPYYEQVAGGNPMTFLDDAPLGTWEWTWYDADDEELDDGTFTVEAAEADVIGQQVEDLNNQITDLASQLSDVTSEFDDVKSDIADVAAIAEQAVAAANQAAEAVQTVAQTANTASQAAADAATAAEAARDAANGLTTLVYGAIGAALVAALAAIVSLMQISRRIAG